jgi:transcriptional regulator with XRE-family HTH domain
MNYEPPSKVASGEVRALLGRNRESIKELADSTSIPLSTLNRRLLGKSAFTIDELDRIAKHFGVEVADLIPRAARVA